MNTPFAYIRNLGSCVHDFPLIMPCCDEIWNLLVTTLADMYKTCDLRELRIFPTISISCHEPFKHHILRDRSQQHPLASSTHRAFFTQSVVQDTT